MKSHCKSRDRCNSNNINLVKIDAMSGGGVCDLEAGEGLAETDALMCAACDPKSLIPHEMHISRFRIANLCCAGEGMVFPIYHGYHLKYEM
jgi:hypothetical protein